MSLRRSSNRERPPFRRVVAGAGRTTGGRPVGRNFCPLPVRSAMKATYNRRRRALSASSPPSRTNSPSPSRPRSRHVQSHPPSMERVAIPLVFGTGVMCPPSTALAVFSPSFVSCLPRSRRYVWDGSRDGPTGRRLWAAGDTGMPATTGTLRPWTCDDGICHCRSRRRTGVEVGR